jgi:phospholipase C
MKTKSFPAIILTIFVSAISAYGAAPCTLNQQNPSVTVCTPTPNALVQSMVHVVAGSTDSNPVTSMQVYVDGTLKQTVKATTLDTFVTLAAGYHTLTVKGWDNTGRSFKQDVPVAMQPPCALNTANQSVTICSLANGSIVSQPFHVVAAATNSNSVKAMTLFVDGVGHGGISSSAILDMYVSNLSLGTHTIGVQAQDSTGFVAKAPKITITVTDKTQGLSNLKHIIFFVQENRSFNNYFGMLGQYRVSLGLSNNIDGINPNAALPNTNGQLVHPYHYQTVCTENLSPSWNESHNIVDGGKMDNFLKTVAKSVPSTIDPTGTRAMGFYDQTDLPSYYDGAARFATSDRFFSPNLSNTIPNRLYLFTATSFGNTTPPSPPAGGFTQKTIFQLLDQAGVSWRYYYHGAVTSSFIQQFSIYKTDSAKVVALGTDSGNTNAARWQADIQNEATLPQVIFIERGGTVGLDEHPGANVQKGAADAVNKIIIPFMQSASWADSAFILAYDEGGALYDHVLPAREIKPDNIAARIPGGGFAGDFNQSGFRVPMIVISPWARANFVSHTTRDYTSILRLIEDTFVDPTKLPAGVNPWLTLRDQNADNMMEFFDFSAGPQLLSAPPLVTQPTTGVCDNKKEKAPGF